MRVSSLAIRFFSEFKEKIFPASYDLVKRLRKRGFRTVCFSMAAFEVALLASRELGMDDCVGTKAVIEESFYTGSLETDLHLPGGKERLAKKLLSDSSFSVGFGDSSSDIGYLDLVDVAFVVNPDDELKKYAESKGWVLLDLKGLSSEELDSLLSSKLN